MSTVRRYVYFAYFTLLFTLRYWTVGTWVRLKWHYCRWRGIKYYL